MAGRAKSKYGELSRRLLPWFNSNRRSLPWRTKGRRDPYKVWLSEVMLQQTTVVAVIPYLERFLARWPDVHSLAEAKLDDVLKEWAGLGYYARARNLHQTAKIIAGERGGGFPETAAELTKLPGIGAYTAKAIAAIAYGERTLPLDGNVTRVLARVFGIRRPLPQARRKIEENAAGLVPEDRPGDFAEALMDLGATVCTPKRPKCPACPLRRECAGAASGQPENFPARAAKRTRPKRRATVFWVETKGRVLVRRRPPSGLLGGMLELPSTDWKTGKGGPPVKASWRKLPGIVRHAFTHFDLELTVKKARLENEPKDAEEFWIPKNALLGEAFPTVMKKVIRKALAA